MTLNLRYTSKLIEKGTLIENLEKISNLKNNEEKVLYLYDVIQGLKLFPDVLEVKKCKGVSICYRNIGNEYFRQTNFSEAWQYYNLALLYAPIDSDEYALAISNRSAVFKILKMYNECLNDIKEVMSRKFPDHLVQKLTKRSALCKEALSKQSSKDADDANEMKSILALQEPRNERYACASSKVEVIFTEQMGRHIIAKEDIKVGEVIAQEYPYLKLLQKSYSLICCSFCLSNSPNLMPCDNCCFSLYCSKDCKERAFKEYHEVECPLMATLMHLDFTQIELAALRTVIRARTDHGSWNELFETIKAADVNMNTKFRGHEKIDGKWLYDSKYYVSIYTLATNIEKTFFLYHLEYLFIAAVFLKLLEDKTHFLNVSKDEDENRVRTFVAGMLLHHCIGSATNMKDISSMAFDEEGCLSPTNIASGCYAFYSLLNHSCSPNVFRCYLSTGEMVLFALKPITKGMQLYDNYGPHHGTENLFYRRLKLRLQYRFTCHCEACVENWPTLMTVLPAENLPINLHRKKEKVFNPGLLEKLVKGDKATAFKLFRPLCDLAKDFDPYAPSLELFRCQEILKQCVKIFGDRIPYRHTKLIKRNTLPARC